MTGESLYEVPEPDPEAQQLPPQDPAGDDWDFDDDDEMRRRYPRIWAKLGLDKLR